MPQEKKVKDLMKPIHFYPSIHADTSLSQALLPLLNSTDAKTVLVVEKEKIIGTLGIGSIAGSLHPEKLTNKYYRGWNLAGWTSPVYMDGLFNDICKRVSMMKVRETMNPLSQSLSPGDNLTKALDLLEKDPNRWAPVSDKGQITGGLSLQDIVGEIITDITTAEGVETVYLQKEANEKTKAAPA